VQELCFVNSSCPRCLSLKPVSISAKHPAQGAILRLHLFYASSLILDLTLLDFLTLLGTSWKIAGDYRAALTLLLIQVLGSQSLQFAVYFK